MAPEPAEGPLDEPTPWDHREALGLVGSFDDLRPQPGFGRDAGGDRALVATVGEQASQPRELPFDPPAGQGQAVAVLDAGRMDR